jgi:hypothetical protein
MGDFGLGMPKAVIVALEAKLASFTFDSIVDRLDEVFSKGWSYHFQGPEIVSVPKRRPRNPQAKNPRSFILIDEPNWQCLCSISISWPDKLQEIVREYSVLLPVEDGSFQVAHDLAFIYTAYYGLGVGKKSKDLFESVAKVELQLFESTDVIEEALKELALVKRKLGISTQAGLDPYVQEWNSELSSHEDIDKTNLRAFISFLHTKEAESVGKPAPTP